MGERPHATANAGSLDDDRTRTAPAPLSRWYFNLPVAFILVSLLALFAIPILIRRQVDSLRRVAETRIEPARDTLDALEFTFAREGTAIRTYVLTGAEETRRIYERLRVQEEAQFEELEALVHAAPGENSEYWLRELRARVEVWHAAHDDVLAGRISTLQAQGFLPPGEPLFDRVLAAAEALDGDLQRSAEAYFAEIEAAERLGAVLTVGLALMALVAVLAALRIQRRLRTLTEALRRRAREETAMRRAAEALGAHRTIDDVLVEIASSALVATGADGAFVERIDPSTAELCVVSAAGGFAPTPRATGPFAGSYTERALAAGRPMRLSQLGRAEHALPGEIIERCDGCDVVVVPLAAAGDAFGALYVVRAPGRRPFDREDIDRVRIFGNLASLAFRNARALSESEAARRDLERVMESRTRLIRGFSHDLKNPLGAADGYLELLEMGLKGELTPEQRASVARSRASIRTALDLIRDLVELARAEAGELRLSIAPLDLRDLIDTTADEYRAQAEAAGLTLAAEVEETLPIVSSDRARIAQILGNLVSNAVKYTPSGGHVTIRARRCNSPPNAVARGSTGGDWVCIDVTDTGPGIPPDQCAAIFEDFIRLEPATAQGIGLGLPISRRIARLLQGDVTVESEVGRGSTFTLWLPVEMSQERAEAA